MENNRDFDLIIWGATGFTGNLVCEYINDNYKYNELNSLKFDKHQLLKRESNRVLMAHL